MLMERQLERRVRYFFDSQRRGRSDVLRFIRALEGVGQLVVIGGMLRDLMLLGNARFRSDLDFVIDPVRADIFEAKMREMGARLNKFGGYSLTAHKWKIDVWSLHDTWAHTAGYVPVNEFSDLRKITFFTCDAIIYNLSTKKIIAIDGYFNQMRQKIIEINLRPNPNPQGNAVRAFRYAVLKEFKWGPKLTQFVAETIAETGWESLVARERSSFNTSYIATIARRDFEMSLKLYLSERNAHPFTPMQYFLNDQLELPLNMSPFQTLDSTRSISS
jgi:hypothetical protein